MNVQIVAKSKPYKEKLGYRIGLDFRKNKGLYLMILPVLVFYALFHYTPIMGILIAFKDYVPKKGIIGSNWVGFRHFYDLFTSSYFWQVLRNTLWISTNNLIWGFPAPIIFALLINEIVSVKCKRAVQTITYLPHFISLVVICGLIKNFVGTDGLINNMFFGEGSRNMLENKNMFVPIYVISSIWTEVGWGSIMYLAALAGIDTQLYEAATIDGAGKWRQTLHVTLPGIVPTIVLLFILRLGSMLNVGYEKIILLYNPLIYDKSDVISTFVYRRGIQEASWSYSTAVGLFNSVISFILIYCSNTASKKITTTSLW